MGTSFFRGPTTNSTQQHFVPCNNTHTNTPHDRPPVPFFYHYPPSSACHISLIHPSNSTLTPPLPSQPPFHMPPVISQQSFPPLAELIRSLLLFHKPKFPAGYSDPLSSTLKFFRPIWHKSHPFSIIHLSDCLFGGVKGAKCPLLCHNNTSQPLWFFNDF
eukprot:TRINITY_DN8217_c0_g1_i1.p1 TRINITY_DN8217_c0_g1~~TRINITY_DN8217_c0_g1_i1.p1  ORF type:complete len:160 (+),score=24.76 TRINITY_DN8217_c0_g1_i1:22-501(+)